MEITLTISTLVQARKLKLSMYLTVETKPPMWGNKDSQEFGLLIKGKLPKSWHLIGI